MRDAGTERPIVGVSLGCIGVASIAFWFDLYTIFSFVIFWITSLWNILVARPAAGSPKAAAYETKTNERFASLNAVLGMGARRSPSRAGRFLITAHHS